MNTVNDMRSWRDDAACTGTDTEMWYPKIRPDQNCNGTHIAKESGVPLKDVQEILNGSRALPQRIKQDTVNLVWLTAHRIGYEPLASDEEIEKLRNICSTCPVLAECAEWALHHEHFGFFGGMMPHERDEVRKKQNILVKDPMSMGTSYSKTLIREQEEERLRREYGE